MKKLLLSAILLYYSLSALSQTLDWDPRSGNKTAEPSIHCGFSIVMEKAKASGFNDAEFEQWLERLITERRNRRLEPDAPPATIYTVPIVFHVLYDGNTESAPGAGSNLSVTKIFSQIQQLNLDFANLSGSAYGVAEHMGVQFAPARVDPSNNYMCEAGINRIDWRARGWTNPNSFTSPNTLISYFDNTIKPNSIWNPNEYVNVWLANMDGSGLLGYATFPATSTLAGLDNTETNNTAGVVVLSGSVGSVTDPGTTSNYAFGRTLTHELGHFFGLRHIWGDGNCATDYCADTPPQNAATSGCPAPGTLNGCTPSVPKMFENYMDYSFDACLNTFTLNQSERSQTVMANSPRRIQLISSTKANSPNPNRVFFKTASASISEAGVSGTCPNFTDYSITVGVEAAATGAATLSLSKNGSALEGQDYTIFPASVTYSNGDATDKTFTLRVFDDAMVEGTESITLDFQITGTGVQTLTSCGPSAISISITDNDFVQTINNSSSTATLLNEGFATAALPAGWTKADAGSSSTNTWVVNSADAGTYSFTGNTAHITNGTGGGGGAMVYTATTPADARLFTPTLNASGLKDLTLTFSYVCNGEILSGTLYDFGLAYYSTGGTYQVLRDGANNPIILQGVNTKTTLNINLPSAANGAATLSFLFRWINDGSVRNNPPLAIDDVLVTGKNTTVETQPGGSATANISQTTGTGYLYSSDGEIIAAISNPSVPIGCLTASISQSGTGTSPITTPAGSFQRSQKVISLVPDVASPAASYSATFYFTTAEVASWADPLALKLLKVSDGIDLSGIVGSSQAQVVNPTVTDMRVSNSYIAYTATFTGGFSRFMLASPSISLPVSWLSFEALAREKSIVLNWKLGAEYHNRGFVVERSLNGTDFSPIAWVDGLGNSNEQTNYAHLDPFVQPGTWYYYRLRQQDLDGRESLSPVRRAQINGKGISLVLLPNPARSTTRLFVPGLSGPADILLYNVQGIQVRSWYGKQISMSPENMNLENLPAGLYWVVVQQGAERYSCRLMIEK